ncbi:MAG TPA: cell division protein FtsL [Candidatus Binatia bacterium]|nr:cell division protein FtsL [Candidatus Binatia bacterium]
MRLRQRLHRDPDPRTRRTIAIALAGGFALVLAGLALVGLRLHQVQLGYRLDQLAAERARLEERLRELEVEAATLRSPARIEGRARQLGLVPPSPKQVRLAREYVTDGTGFAARHRLTASAGDPGPATRPKAALAQ